MLNLQQIIQNKPDRVNKGILHCNLQNAFFAVNQKSAAGYFFNPGANTYFIGDLCSVLCYDINGYLDETDLVSDKKTKTAKPAA